MDKITGNPLSGLRFEYNPRPYKLVSPILRIGIAVTLWKKKWEVRRGTTLKSYLFWYDRLPAVGTIRRNATNWRALDVLYNCLDRKSEAKGWRRHLERFWLKMINPQALRNRKKIVVSCISGELRRLLESRERAKVLSLACGSMQATIEGVGIYTDKVDLTCVDSDPTAIENARNLVAQKNISAEFHVENLLHLPRSIRSKKYDLVEMVGFLDYANDSLLICLINRCYDMLAPGGALITGHVHPNSEAEFHSVCTDWKMLYRPKPVFLDLVEQTKFGGHYEAYTEPHSIHTVVVCRRD